MRIKKLLLAAAFVGVTIHPASAVQFTVNDYTASSLTFTVAGNMPASPPEGFTLQTSQLDILYTGNLWVGTNGFSSNVLSASPIVGNRFAGGNTGGYDLPYHYSWLEFGTPLMGQAGTGSAVTLTWGGNRNLNTTGSGSFDLYWGNLGLGLDPAGQRNLLLASVRIVDGRIVDAADVPEPATLALFGASLAALATARRRRRHGACGTGRRA